MTHVARFADVFALAVAVIILMVGVRHVLGRWQLRPAQRPLTALLALALLLLLGYGMSRVAWALLYDPTSTRAALDLLFMNAGFLLGYGLTARGERSP